ncbi:phosphomethylpyrimidine synthase ThiC [Candidatus Woesearchaeota archaeon]|nr:phosphomethylpyrimidine synthase ThiC [Candidatus Woesearchaeota archaeon]
MTQLKEARKGRITDEIKEVARQEFINPKQLRKLIAKGRVVLPRNVNHAFSPIGIGKFLRTKVNANIGSSPNSHKIDDELKKLEICTKYKADTVMDLSTGGDIDKIRRAILKNSSIPVGTVPIYQAMVEKESIEDVTEDDILNAIEKHIRDGVDFITVHSGLTKNAIPLVEKRLMGAVSRGGSFLVRWMKHNDKENPLYDNFKRILELAGEYDVTLSLGDGLRPGAIKDSTDKAQLHELKVLGKLAKNAWKNKVQAMIEGPGHIPLHEIEKNMKLQQKYCHKAPFYVLGPLVTDVAPGYDHITSAIGGAIASWHGADFLCYVTAAEHLRLPNADEVREGIIAARIAAHAGDIAKGIKKAAEWDNELSKNRKNFDWKNQFELAMDPEKAERMRKESCLNNEEYCTMCGKFCSMRK